MKNFEKFTTSIKDRPVAVFGLGRSGLSAVRALKREEVNVFAWDDNEESRRAGEEAGALVVALDEKNLKDCAFLLLAPGVPLHFPAPHPVVKAARKAGIEIICDVELFHRLGHGRKTIGVTGTNGKSTTTALIHHILKSAGKESVMGGNIGIPVFDLPVPGEDGVFVFELSSYQLDLCPTFTPDIAVLLNITSDHLERHGTLENYAASKARIFAGKGTAIVGIDDKHSKDIYGKISTRGERQVNALSIQDADVAFLQDNMILKGAHNIQNALAAYKVCRVLGLDKEEILAGLCTFPGLPHRQYPVRDIGRVTYINDSKATNAEAASKALASYENIYWIAGGRAKEGGLAGLENLMPRVREAFLIGEAMDDFAAWMKKNNVVHHKSGTLDVAIAAAHKAAQKSPPAVVLLAPACSSWDQFSSYEERGDVFSKVVGTLEKSAAA